MMRSSLLAAACVRFLIALCSGIATPAAAIDLVTPTPTSAPLVYVSISHPAPARGALAVIDASDNTVRTYVPMDYASSVWGLALTPDGYVTYVTNPDDGEVAPVYGISEHANFSAWTIGLAPKGVAISPDGLHAYVTRSAGHDIAIFETYTDELESYNGELRGIRVGAGPTDVVLSADGRTGYVTNAGDDTVSVIDIADRTVIETISLPSAPVSIAVAPDARRAYVTLSDTQNSLAVIDTTTNSLVPLAATLALGIPGKVAIGLDGKRIYVAGLEAGVVTVIDTASLHLLQTIRVGRHPFGIVLTPDGRRAYVANRGDSRQGAEAVNSSVSVIDTSLGEVVRTIPVLGMANDVAFRSGVAPRSAIAAGSAYGQPGGQVSIAVTLDTGGNAVGSLEHDLAVDSPDIYFAPDCSIDPTHAIYPNGPTSTAISYLPKGCSSDCSGIHVAMRRVETLAPIPSSVLYTCNVNIRPTAARAAHLLNISNVKMNNVLYSEISNIEAVSGTIFVQAGSCVGDCNGDGAVDIDEIIYGINIALTGVGACPALECNSSGLGVSIDCLVRSVRNGVDGCPSPPAGTPGGCCNGECPGNNCSPQVQSSCCFYAQHSDIALPIAWCPPDRYDATTGQCSGCTDACIGTLPTP